MLLVCYKCVLLCWRCLYQASPNIFNSYMAHIITTHLPDCKHTCLKLEESCVLLPWRSAATFHTHAGLHRLIKIKNKLLLPSWAFLSQTNVAFRMEKRHSINGRWASDGLLGWVATGPGRGWWQLWWQWCTLNANVGLRNAQTGVHWNAELMCFLRVIYWGRWVTIETARITEWEVNLILVSRALRMGWPYGGVTYKQ